MKNTAEQNKCVEIYAKKAPFKIEAVAGSGKTTTIRIMAESDSSRSALYLAFNKAAATEAGDKMPINTQCRTTHSIAYQAIITPNPLLRAKLSRPPYDRNNYVNAGGTVKEIANLANVKRTGGVNRLAIARLAKQAVSTFEASSVTLVDKAHVSHNELNILERKAAAFQEPFDRKKVLKAVVECARILWTKRIDQGSPVVMTHDTYLKLYQLSKPSLDYDVIFLDEAQDTSDCVIDIVMQTVERGTQIVCVGDTFQSIYGWRGAVNALAKIQTQSTPLSQSWRYGPAVAAVATHILDKAMIVKGSPHLDTVVGPVDTSKPYTMLFRTNTKLIQKGQELIREGHNIRMDVDVKGFVRLLDSMIALKFNDKKNVKHEDVLIHESWQELLDEAEVVNGELKLLSGLIERGNPDEVLASLRSYQPSNNPHVILSTAHKSKGMEYQQVILAEDFMDVFDKEGNFVEPPEMERNLLYVAATRAMGVLELNSTVEAIIDYRLANDDEMPIEDVLEREGFSTTSIEEKFDTVVRNQVRSLQQDMNH